MIYSQHGIPTGKQGASQNLDEFIQNPKSLNRDLNFKTISAETHMDYAIRDELKFRYNHPASNGDFCRMIHLASSLFLTRLVH